MRSRLKVVLVGGFVLIGQGCPPPSPPSSAPTMPPQPRRQVQPADTSFIGAGQPTDTTFVGAVRQASVIFDGVVLSRDSSAIVSAPSHFTALVRVGQVFRSPLALDDFSGDTVVVVLADTTGIRPGANAAFFTYGLSAGSRLVVQEVRHQPAPPGSGEPIRNQIAAADSIITDRDIQARSAPAFSDAVVLGRVDSTHVVPDSSGHRGGEHMPKWGRATVYVMKAFRGQDSALVNQRAKVLYAIGGSMLTESAPELHAGESRIFWLRRLSRLSEGLRAGIDTTGQYFVLDAEDTRPASDSTRVARALSPSPARFSLPPGGHR